MKQQNTLIYGEVQSGKTAAIIQSITHFKPEKVKIIVIQNTLLMFTQYAKIIEKNKISYYNISKNNVHKKQYNGEKTIIVMCNKYRMKYLCSFLARNHINNYCAILDESDIYIQRLNKLYQPFQTCTDLLHVTATPFIYAKKFKIDQIRVIPPPIDYIGIRQLDKQMFPVPSLRSECSELLQKITNIIHIDFLTQPSGMMLINCFFRLQDMHEASLSISHHFPHIPVAVFSSTNTYYLGGQVICRKKESNLQKTINQMNDKSHVIFIAGRLSGRGLNYTNLDYTRFLTHQITAVNNQGNMTTFLQKCRICGIRQQPAQIPKLYCAVSKAKHLHFIDSLIKRLDTLVEDIEKIEAHEIRLNSMTKQELLALFLEEQLQKITKMPMTKKKMIELLLPKMKERQLKINIVRNAYYMPQTIFYTLPPELIEHVVSYLPVPIAF